MNPYGTHPRQQRRLHEAWASGYRSSIYEHNPYRDRGNDTWMYADRRRAWDEGRAANPTVIEHLRREALREQERRRLAEEQNRRRERMRTLVQQLNRQAINNDLDGVIAAIDEIKAERPTTNELLFMDLEKIDFTINNAGFALFQSMPNAFFFGWPIIHRLDGDLVLKLNAAHAAVLHNNLPMLELLYDFNSNLVDKKAGLLAYSLEYFNLLPEIDEMIGGQTHLFSLDGIISNIFDPALYSQFRAKFIRCINYLEMTDYFDAPNLIAYNNDKNEDTLAFAILNNRDVEFMQKLFYLTDFNATHNSQLRLDMTISRDPSNMLTEIQRGIIQQIQNIPAFAGRISPLYRDDKMYVLFRRDDGEFPIIDSVIGNILAFATLTGHMPMIEYIASVFIERGKIPLKFVLQQPPDRNGLAPRILIGSSWDVAPEGGIRDFLTAYHDRIMAIAPQTEYPVEHLRSGFPAPPPVLPERDVVHAAINSISLEDLEAGMPMVDFISEADSRTEHQLGRYYTASSFAQWYDSRKALARQYGRAMEFINPMTRSRIDMRTIQYYKVGRVLPEAVAPNMANNEPVPEAPAPEAPFERRRSPRLERLPRPNYRALHHGRGRKITKRVKKQRKRKTRRN